MAVGRDVNALFIIVVELRWTELSPCDMIVEPALVLGRARERDTSSLELVRHPLDDVDLDGPSVIATLSVGAVE